MSLFSNLWNGIKSGIFGVTEKEEKTQEVNREEKKQGVKRKRDEEENIQEQEIKRKKEETIKQTIIQNIINDRSIIDISSEFIEKKTIIDCVDKKNVLYILIGEKHDESIIAKINKYMKENTKPPKVEDLRRIIPSPKVTMLINNIANKIKQIDGSSNIFLLTEGTKSKDLEHLYWNFLHSFFVESLYSEIIKCDIREEFIKSEIIKLSNKLYSYNDYPNAKSFVTIWIEAIEKTITLTKISSEIIKKPIEIINYPPFIGKDFNEEMKTHIVDIIQKRISCTLKKEIDSSGNVISSYEYKKFVNDNYLEKYKNVKISDFIQDEAKVELDINAYSTRDEIIEKLSNKLQYKLNEIGSLIPEGITITIPPEMKETIKNIKNEEMKLFCNNTWIQTTKYVKNKNGQRIKIPSTKIEDYIEDSDDYLKLLYGVILDVEVILQMRRIENIPVNELKVIITFTGSKHTEAYEDLFDIVKCEPKNIGVVKPSKEDTSDC